MFADGHRLSPQLRSLLGTSQAEGIPTDTDVAAATPSGPLAPPWWLAGMNTLVIWVRVLLTLNLCACGTTAAWAGLSHVFPSAVPPLPQQLPWQQLLLPAAAATCALYAVAAVLSLRVCQSLILFGHSAKHLGPSNSAGPFDRGLSLWRRDYTRPALSGLPHALNVRVSTPDGERLGAWHVLPPGRVSRSVALRLETGASRDAAFDAALSDSGAAAGGSAESPVAVLYLHGNWETRSKWLSVEHAKFLSAHLGCHVLLLDYRGFADSTGTPTERGVCIDGRAAVQWLAERGVRPSRVCLWGHSLGTAVAAQVASQLQAQGLPPQALVLESPFYSARAAALTFPLAQVVRALPGGTGLMLRFFGFGFRTYAVLPELRMPLLVLHGTHDDTVPIQHSLALLRSRLQNTDVAAQTHFLPLRGCDHLHCIFEPQVLAGLMVALKGTVPA